MGGAGREHVHALGLPQAAPDRPTVVEIEFEAGDAVAVDGAALSSATLLERLNELAALTASAGSTWWRTASSA